MRWLFLAAALFSFSAHAAEIETYAPKHRSAGELAEVTDRLAGRGVVITAFGEKIVIRADSKKQIREVRSILKKLDSPVKQWRVEVRGNDHLQSEGSEFGLGGIQENTKDRKRKHKGGMIVRGGSTVSLVVDDVVWRLTPNGGGSSVILKVDRVGGGGVAILSTEITVQPGRWISIGGADEQSDEERGRILHRGAEKTKSGSRVEIRLMEI